MSRVGRLAGAILAETEGQYFLVGNTKEPCNFAQAGFEAPVEVDALKRPYLKLSVTGSVDMDPPWLTLPLEGEGVPRLLGERFLIERNGSVSDRLWRMVLSPDAEEAGAPVTQSIHAQAINARWLAEIPAPVWQIVRDTVLRCM
jgi:hypothetical protein